MPRRTGKARKRRGRGRILVAVSAIMIRSSMSESRIVARMAGPAHCVARMEDDKRSYALIVRNPGPTSWPTDRPRIARQNRVNAILALHPGYEALRVFKNDRTC